MFETLSDRLGGVFDKLRGRGALTEDDVRSALREVRVALLEADVALPVARDFVETVTTRAVDRLIETLTSVFSRYFSPSLADSRSSSWAVVMLAASSSPMNGMEMRPARSTS